MKLTGKVALISGLGNRFGKAAALLMAKEGAKLAMIARSTGTLNDVADQIKAEGGQALIFEADSTVSNDVKTIISDVASHYGNIHILLNNAGGNYTKHEKLHEFSENKWNEIISNNLKSVFLFSKYCIPIMIEQGGGSIINVSAAAKTLQDGNCAYATSKMGVIGLTRNLAREYSKMNIRVNCVCPGVIRHDAKNYKSLQNIEYRLWKTGQSEDVAQSICFFASDASCWITSQTLSIDGGEENFISIPKPS